MSKDSRGGEPVAWQWLDTAHFRKKIPPHSNAAEWRPLFTSPQPAEPPSELMRLMPEVLASLRGSGVDVSLAADVERALAAAPKFGEEND